MKSIHFIALISLIILGCAPIPSVAQDIQSDSTGLDGDQFSLEGALDLFKQSGSLEAFEKKLNETDNSVNNLDLNEDGEVDYIRVIDHMDGNVHVIVLQVPVSEKENQDVAVLELEKTGEETAVLQIVGDEDLYGMERIAEPTEAAQAKPVQGRNGPNISAMPLRFVVNVWLWPSVRFMYAPGYRVYVSPWRWRVYPGWYRPFRPRPWHVFHVGVRPYRAHYTVVTTRRVVRARPIYAPHRAHAKVVHTRTTTRVTGPRGGHYRKTTTTTKVRSNGGGHRGGRGRH